MNTLTPAEIRALELLPHVDSITICLAIILLKDTPSQFSTILVEELPAPSVEWLQSQPITPVFAYCAAIASREPKAFTGQQLATIAQRLIDHEQQLGGPYLDEKGMLRSDLNTYIYLFLQTCNVTLPALQKIIKQDLPSPTAPATILQYITDPSPQNLTLATTSLQSTARRDQFFQEILSIAENRAPLPAPINQQSLYRYIETIAREELQSLPEIFRAPAQDLLDQIITADKKSREILLLPVYFAAHLGLDSPTSQLAQLGLANLYCWMAYTLLDDAIDDQQITPLPMATALLRKVTNYYSQLYPQQSAVIENLFSTMDAANAHEIAHSRFIVIDNQITIPQIPEFDLWKQVGAKSAAHIAGPLCLAQEVPAPNDTVESGLRAYLIARQLQDDLHDWRNDLQAGHCSFVVAQLLHDAQVPFGTHSITLLLKQLEHTFWHQTCQKVCQEIINQVQIAKQINPSAEQTDFSQLVGNIEASAIDAQRQIIQQKAFLSSFTEKESPPNTARD